MGRALVIATTVRETTTRVQEIRMHKHHKELHRWPQLPQDGGGLLGKPTSAMCHSCSSTSGFSFSFTFWISHWQNQNQNPAVKRLWAVQCPGSQPLRHGERLSKTGIRLRTIRQYAAGIQYPDAEITLVLFSRSAPWALAGRPSLSRQEVISPKDG